MVPGWDVTFHAERTLRFFRVQNDVYISLLYFSIFICRLKNIHISIMIAFIYNIDVFCIIKFYIRKNIIYYVI